MDKTTGVFKSIKKNTPWGHEISWLAIHSIHGKILKILKGQKTSLKYHTSKNEVLYVMSGRIMVTHADEAIHHYTNVYAEQDILMPGDALSVPAMCIYRVEALEDSEIIEIGNHSNSPVVRIEDEYGRPVKNFHRKIEVRKDGKS